MVPNETQRFEERNTHHSVIIMVLPITKSSGYTYLRDTHRVQARTRHTAHVVYCSPKKTLGTGQSPFLSLS